MHKNEQYAAKDICQILKISRSTINQWIEEKDFPEPIRIPPHCNRWNASEVNEWIEDNFVKSVVRAKRARG